MRKSALVVAPETPYPITGGGALRTASILEYLSTRYDLDVVLFSEPAARDPREDFPRGLARELHVVQLQAHRRDVLSRYLRNAERLIRGAVPLVDRYSGYTLPREITGRHYALAMIEHFWCVAYAVQIARKCDGLWIDLHNVESAYYRSLAQTSSHGEAFAFRRFAQSAERLERQFLPAFTGALVASDDDAARVRTLCNSPAHVYPNAIPLAAQPAPPKTNSIVFSGNLEYPPNRTAVAHFRHRIWPLLRETNPGLTWRIVGKNPHAIEAIVSGDASIQVVGPVSDALHEIARSRVAVVPVLNGSGTRLKIIEAWAAGTPVVSTPLGAEGLHATDGEQLIVRGGPIEFASAVTSILQDEAMEERLRLRGREFYECYFTWPAAWRTLAALGI